jgi:hypothetical protein
MAASTDKFLYTGTPGTATTLSSPGYTIGDSSITIGSTANFPTASGVVFAIDTVTIVNGKEVQTPGTYSVFSGLVTNGTTVSTLTLEYGTAQNYASGALTRVYIPISSVHNERLITGILAQHAQDGTHKNITSTNATFTNATITNLTVGGQTPSPDWSTIGTTPTTVTNNGQGSYNVVYNGTNLTNVIQPGTRLRTTRTVAAPTQSTSLNGTSQYWVKTSPNKLTFTDDFVVSAWIKLTSYASSQIISRYNGTSGWEFRLLSDGRVRMSGYNAGANNISSVDLYQSVPLNKWVHITAQLDMSAFTATTTTSYVMLDGVDVPVTLSRGGTIPTALVQAGNLEVGSINGGTQLFPGKIAQAAVFNAKVTQATMRGYYSQGLAGTETSLASAFSFNGNTNDLNTTTPNNLVAGAGSPTATEADSPFGTQGSGLISSTLDYGIVHSATFSTNTTLVVQVPNGCTIPTSGGVSASAYSGLKVPYGMPTQRGRWTLIAIKKYSTVITATTGVWTSLDNYNMLVPIGNWELTQSGMAWANFSGTSVNVSRSLSTSTSAETDEEFTTYAANQGASGSLVATQQARMSKAVTLSAATLYYVIHKTSSPTGTGIRDIGNEAPSIISAVNGLL